MVSDNENGTPTVAGPKYISLTGEHVDVTAVGTSSEGACLACAGSSQLVTYGPWRLCAPCASHVLQEAIVPAVQQHELALLGPTAVSFETHVAETRQNIDIDRPDAEWACSACGVRNDDESSACGSCGAERVRLMCDRCGNDALQVEFCHAVAGSGGKARTHDMWECQSCQQKTLSGGSCRACGGERVWYCARCSLENPFSSRACAVCGGLTRLRSLARVQERLTAEQVGSTATDVERSRQAAELQTVGKTRLLRRLRRLGLVSVEAADDGNCLFEGLAFQLARCPALAPVVRHVVVNHVLANPGTYDFMVSGGLDAWATEMSRDRAWGDEVVVLAAAAVFNLSVHLVSSAPVRWYHHFKPSTSAVEGVDAVHRSAVILAYVEGTHYFSAVRAGGFTEEAVVDIRPLAMSRQPPPATPAPALDIEVVLLRLHGGGYVCTSTSGRHGVVERAAGDAWYALHFITGDGCSRIILQHVASSRLLGIEMLEGDGSAVTLNAVDSNDAAAEGHTLLCLSQDSEGRLFQPLAACGGKLATPGRICVNGTVHEGNVRFALHPLFSDAQAIPGPRWCTRCHEWFGGQPSSTSSTCQHQSVVATEAPRRALGA